MSNLINPKPRFGYNPTLDSIYDYVAQKDLAPTNKNYAAPDGTWDLTKVKAAILAGQTIEGAHLTVKTPSPPATGTTPNPKPAAPTPVAGTVPAPSTAPVAPPTDAAQPAHNPPKIAEGLTGSQLQALKLSALQSAALGIKPAMLSTGVTPAQIKAWGLTSERATALKLTDAQRAVLMP